MFSDVSIMKNQIDFDYFPQKKTISILIFIMCFFSHSLIDRCGGQKCLGGRAGGWFN